MICTITKFFAKNHEYLADPEFRIKAQLCYDTERKQYFWKVHPKQLTLAGCTRHLPHVRVSDGMVHCRWSVLKPCHPTEMIRIAKEIKRDR